MSEITLDYPVEFEGQAVKTLSMRRPKVRDDLAKERGGTSPGAQEVQLFADLCGVKADLIRELDMADYGKLQEAYAGFFTPPAAMAPSHTETASGG